ncbi:hypothetical protein CFP56_002755 [Quercus suber]|uniref:Uncharacterized protein n=1 Tax=Quercus suber TaxID=58331 RepID=A0AAW0LDG4_QUESU
MSMTLPTLSSPNASLKITPFSHLRIKPMSKPFHFVHYQQNHHLLTHHVSQLVFSQDFANKV